MEKNIGKKDRNTRIIIAIILVVLAYANNVWWLYLIAAALFITAVIGFCLPYKWFKINTNKKE